MVRDPLDDLPAESRAHVVAEIRVVLGVDEPTAEDLVRSSEHCGRQWSEPVAWSTPGAAESSAGCSRRCSASSGPLGTPATATCRPIHGTFRAGALTPPLIASAGRLGTPRM